MKNIFLLLFLFCSVAAFSQVAVMGGGVPAEANMVSNGTFDSTDDWTTETGWTIGSNVATFDNVTTGGIQQVNADMVSPLVHETNYTIEYDVTSGASGWSGLYNIANNYDYLSWGNLTMTAGHHSVDFTTGSLSATDGFQIRATSSEGGFSIDNIEIYER